MLKSLFGKSDRENIQFLTTQGMNYHLETMFQDAETEIVIIAPYIKLHPRLRDTLLRKADKGVDITFVCREQDVKEDLGAISKTVIDNPHLHAKCYLTEKAVIIGSLNLYDFSQVNNDEMGILVPNEEQGKKLYQTIRKEADRLCSQCMLKPSPLVRGQKYSLDQLDAWFDFDYKKMSGIKFGNAGDLFLFSHSKSKYGNKHINGEFHFQGQNNCGGSDKPLYNNEKLFNCFGNSKATIHLFKDFVYQGQVYISSKPYFDNAWFFPLKPSK